jgi:hypothetical protein
MILSPFIIVCHYNQAFIPTLIKNRSPNRWNTYIIRRPKLGTLSQIVDCPAQTRSWSNVEYVPHIHIWNPNYQLELIHFFFLFFHPPNFQNYYWNCEVHVISDMNPINPIIILKSKKKKKRIREWCIPCLFINYNKNHKDGMIVSPLNPTHL